MDWIVPKALFLSSPRNVSMKRLKSAFWRGFLPVAVLVAAALAGPGNGVVHQAFQAIPAWAAGLFTNGVCTAGSTGVSTGTPAVTYCNNSNTYPLTGVEQIPADTELSGGQSPQSEAIQVRQLSQYGASLLSGNVLIGGDATSNLFQRGTTGSSVTTTATYGGPDRWAYWSGTNTAMTVSQATTAASLPTGYADSFRMQRTASQTGVVQMCMAQEVSSANSYQLAGQTVELDFHAYTGANFSAASNQMTAYVIYGTGQNEGMSNMAFGLNGGGGGSAGWTGQTNIASTISLQGVSTLGKYAAVVKLPATATEVGVALCYKPVGTAGTTDAVYFSGIQLRPNNALAANALTTAGNGYSCDNAGNTQIQCSAFQRRPDAVEANLQYRYFYQISEPASGAVVGTCQATSTSAQSCIIQLPQAMRATPSLTITTGTFKENIAGTPTTWVTPTAGTNTPVAINITTGNTTTAGQMLMLTGGGGSGVIAASSEL